MDTNHIENFVEKYFQQREISIKKKFHSTVGVVSSLKKYCDCIMDAIEKNMSNDPYNIKVFLQNKDRNTDTLVFDRVFKIMKNLGYDCTYRYDNEGLGYVTLLFKMNLP